jgi:hypothetical protein
MRPSRQLQEATKVGPGAIGKVFVMNVSSMEDWYKGQPAVVHRRVKLVDYYTFDQHTRVSVEILDGPEKGRKITGQSPGQLLPPSTKSSKKAQPQRGEVGTEG